MSTATCASCGVSEGYLHKPDCPCLTPLPSSPPPQPALDRISAEADEADARYASQRERAERAEAAVAELERRMAAMRREHEEAVGDLVTLLEDNATLVTARAAIDRLFATYGDSLQRMAT